MPYRAVLAFPLAATLALAGCFSQLPDEEYNPDNPLDHTRVSLVSPGEGIPAVRAKLDVGLRREKGAAAVLARLVPLGYRCVPEGRGLLMCRYSHHFHWGMYTAISRYRLDYVALIDPDRETGKIRQLCVSHTLVNPEPHRPPPGTFTRCDPE